MDNVFVALPLEAVERPKHRGAPAHEGAARLPDRPTTRSAPSSSSSATASSSSQVSDGRLGVWAVLVAAGRGERLGADRPKAFANLGGRPLLAESLERLEASDWIEAFVVVAPAGVGGADASSSPRSSGAGKVRAAVAGGSDAGRTRCAPASPRCPRRPPSWSSTTPPGRSSRRGPRARRHGARRRAGTAPSRRFRSADTVKRAEGGAVVETVDRTGLHAAQTPQALPRGRCCAARSPAATEATDCAGLVEAAGGRVRLVEGDRRLAQGDDTRPTSSFVEVLLRGGGVIVDYHMHLRGPANGREGPVELTVDAVERFVEQAARARRRRDRLHRAHVLLPPGRAAARASLPSQPRRATTSTTTATPSSRPKRRGSR